MPRKKKNVISEEGWWCFGGGDLASYRGSRERERKKGRKGKSGAAVGGIGEGGERDRGVHLLFLGSGLLVQRRKRRGEKEKKENRRDDHRVGVLDQQGKKSKSL